jgi:hypothetical protein
MLEESCRDAVPATWLFFTSGNFSLRLKKREGCANQARIEELPPLSLDRDRYFLKVQSDYRPQFWRISAFILCEIARMH